MAHVAAPAGAEGDGDRHDSGEDGKSGARREHLERAALRRRVDHLVGDVGDDGARS